MAQIRLKQLNGLNNSSGKKPIQIIFTTSKAYTLPSGYKSMDIFLVGSGGGGGCGYSSRSDGNPEYSVSGSGGGGGYTFTQKLIGVSNRAVTINIRAGGAGGIAETNIAPTDGGDTTAIINGTTYKAGGGKGGTNADERYNASGGNGYIGGNGGSGGGAGWWRLSNQTRSDSSGSYYRNDYSHSYAGEDGSDSIGLYYILQSSSTSTRVNVGCISKGQGSSTKAFGDNNGTLYAGGGGTGYAYTTSNNVSSENYSNGYSGAGGGGNGGYKNDGSQGSDNYGGGGGAGAGDPTYLDTPKRNKNGGRGGTGIVIIRLYPDSKRPSVMWSDKNTITINS